MDFKLIAEGSVVFKAEIVKGGTNEVNLNEYRIVKDSLGGVMVLKAVKFRDLCIFRPGGIEPTLLV